MFSKVKAHLRTAKARQVGTLIDAMGEGLAKVTALDIVGWFRSCGYRQAQT